VCDQTALARYQLVPARHLSKHMPLLHSAWLGLLCQLLAGSVCPVRRCCLKRAAEKCACADLQRRFVLPKSVDFDGAVGGAARRGRPLPQRAHRDLPPDHDHHRDGHILLRKRRRRSHLPRAACRFSAPAYYIRYSLGRSACPSLASTVVSTKKEELANRLSGPRASRQTRHMCRHHETHAALSAGQGSGP